MSSLLKIAIALVFIMHGIGHTMGFLAAWTTVPVGFTGKSWLLSNGVSIDSGIGKVFGLLWLVALGLTVIAGVGMLGNQDWWRPMAIAGAVVSLAVIIPWWVTIPSGSAIGAALVDLLVLIALVPPWGDELVRAFR